MSRSATRASSVASLSGPSIPQLSGPEARTLSPATRARPRWHLWGWLHDAADAGRPTVDTGRGAPAGTTRAVPRRPRPGRRPGPQYRQVVLVLAAPDELRHDPLVVVVDIRTSPSGSDRRQRSPATNPIPPAPGTRSNPMAGCSVRRAR